MRKKQQNGHENCWIWVGKHWMLIATKGTSIRGKTHFILALVKSLFYKHRVETAPPPSLSSSSLHHQHFFFFFTPQLSGKLKLGLWLCAFLPSARIWFLIPNNYRSVSKLNHFRLSQFSVALRTNWFETTYCWHLSSVCLDYQTRMLTIFQLKEDIFTSSSHPS